MQYKYQLEKYTGIKSRFTCPDCERRNSFTRYVDVETNEYIADNVGICNRKIKCGYHKAPKEYLEQNNTPYFNNKISIKKIENVKPMDTIPLGKLEKSITNKSINNFIEFLYSNFDKQSVDKVIELYRIGTHDYWKGATVFWQIDSHNKIRTGKLMLYNSNTGKRVKKPHSHINWYHSIFKKKHNLTEYNLEQCLFGEHILIDKNCNDIAIVESEKTAIICSIYFPNIVWLASGGLTNITEKKLKPFLNKNVKLFPDNGAFDKWKEKANQFNFSISTLLEEKGNNGQDIADLLLHHENSIKTIN